MTTEQDALQATLLPPELEGEATPPSSPPDGGGESQQPPSETPSAVTPEPTPAPAPEPTPTPQIDVEALQRQVMQQDQWIQAYQERQRQEEVKTAAATYKAQLEATYNYSEEQLNAMTGQFEQYENSKVEMQRNYIAALNNERAKIQTAMHFGQKYGVDAQTLLQYDSPWAMEQAGQQVQRIAGLEKKVGDLTKAQVPPQEFNSPEGTGSASNSDFMAGIANNRIPLTEANSARLEKILYPDG